MTGLAKSKNHPMSDWNEERTNRLKQYWHHKHSSEWIADKLGITRNAVIGKVHRLGLDSHADWRGPPKAWPPRAKPDHSSVSYYLSKNPVRVPASAPLPNNDVDIPASQRRTLLELEPHHCRWPLGGPTEKAVFFCGGPADLTAGQPYCQQHAARAFNGPARRVAA